MTTSDIIFLIEKYLNKNISEDELTNLKLEKYSLFNDNEYVVELGIFGFTDENNTITS